MNGRFVAYALVLKPNWIWPKVLFSLWELNQNGFLVFLMFSDFKKCVFSTICVFWRVSFFHSIPLHLEIYWNMRLFVIFFFLNGSQLTTKPCDQSVQESVWYSSHLSQFPPWQNAKTWNEDKINNNSGTEFKRLNSESTTQYISNVQENIEKRNAEKLFLNGKRMRVVEIFVFPK